MKRVKRGGFACNYLDSTYERIEENDRKINTLGSNLIIAWYELNMAYNNRSFDSIKTAINPIYKISGSNGHSLLTLSVFQKEVVREIKISRGY